MKRIVLFIALFFISIVLCCGCNKQNSDDEDNRKQNEVVFAADFSKSSPLSTQFYSWEDREYENKLYEPLSSIECEDNTAHLKAYYDDSVGLWKTQMMSTAGIFESDNFTCEFQGKFSGELGSWQCVITYGTGLYWSNGVYSDAMKWPAGGEIDVFEQSFQKDSETGENKACFIPAVHYGTGRESGYPDSHLVERGDTVTFTANEWHHFKFSLSDGILTAWIDGSQICRNDYSSYNVSNNYLCEYFPFLNPQAFYIEAGIDIEQADKSKEYELCIKDFIITQQENVECETLKIYPQMWESGQDLVYPIGAEIYLAREYKPVNTSNKSCKWSSSNESVATVSEGYVKTLKCGEAIISAKCGNAVAEYKVVVSENASIPVTKIDTLTDSITLKKDQKWDLEYYIYPSFATEDISITTEDDNIVSIEGNTIEGREIGETTLLFESDKVIQKINISVEENTREPFAEYDLSQVTSLIGTNKKQNEFSTVDTIMNTGEDNTEMDLSVEYNISNILFENEWTEGITSVYLKSPLLKNPKKLTEYSTLYLLRGTEGKLRTNSENVNCMPSIDITSEEIVVRYGDVSFYQTSNSSNDKPHIIGVYLNEGKSYLYVDGDKVVDGARIDYIQDLQQLIFSSNETNGLEYFAAYLNVEFSDAELSQMTSISN